LVHGDEMRKTVFTAPGLSVEMLPFRRRHDAEEEGLHVGRGRAKNGRHRRRKRT
jgi:hypothetical protein